MYLTLVLFYKYAKNPAEIVETECLLKTLFKLQQKPNLMCFFKEFVNNSTKNKSIQIEEGRKQV